MSEHWRAESACIGMDTDIFFPSTGESSEPAKEVCRRCPVSAECLEWATRTGQESGVWGGLAEGERRKRNGNRAIPEVGYPSWCGQCGKPFPVAASGRRPVLCPDCRLEAPARRARDYRARHRQTA